MSTPPNEGAQFASFIERNCREIMTKLAGRTEVQLNQPLPIPDANTLFAIATHAVGMAEFWTLVLVGGRIIPRDRASEFRASGSGSALLARYEKFIGDAHSVLDALSASAMQQVVEPPPAFRSSGGFGSTQMTVRDCLLHVLEHTATHLGHIQLTCDLLDYQP